MSDKFSSTQAVYNQFSSQFVKHFEKKLDTLELDHFLQNVTLGGFILDAGCGSARDAAYFISQGYKAMGIDLSEGLFAKKSQD